MSEYNFLSCLLRNYELNILFDFLHYKYFAHMKASKSNLVHSEYNDSLLIEICCSVTLIYHEVV